MAMKTDFDSHSVDLKEGDEFIAMESSYGFTEGQTYTVESSYCSCCKWAFRNDEGSLRVVLDGLPAMKKVVKSVPPFQDLDQNEKGMLLLDKFNGKVVQFYNPLSGAWVDDDENEFVPEMSYRAKPQALIDAEMRAATLKAELAELEEVLAA